MPRLTAEELAGRRLGMGSTDVVEACGFAPWQGAGPMRLYCEKRGITSADDAQEVDEDRAAHLEWGHTMEPVILAWYERTYGVSCVPGGHVTSRDEPWLWASLDATVFGQGRILEIKNVSSPALYRHWDVSSQDGIPSYVRAQVTVAMFCHGAREADVVACIGGRPPHVWRVSYDAELARLLVEGALRFWAMTVAGTPPPLDATDASRAYLLSRYPVDVRPTLASTPEVDDLAERRAEQAGDEKRAAAEKRRLDALLMAAVGDAQGVEGTWGKFTWKCGKDGTRRTRFTGRDAEE